MNIKRYILLFAILIAQVSLAQNTIFVNINQPATLFADAGDDITICIGDTIEIGGSPSAINGSGNYSYFWSPNIRLSSTSIANPKAYPVNTTTYTLVVTDGNSCTDLRAITVTVDQCVSTNFKEIDAKINIYPNPANDLINIVLDDFNLDNLDLEIIDIAGRIVLKEAFRINNKKHIKTIDASTFPAGLYFINIKGEGCFFNNKIIVNK
jgi:hypothetical protein